MVTRLDAEGGVFLNVRRLGTMGERHVAKAAGIQEEGGYGPRSAIVVSVTLTCTYYDQKV